MPRRPKAPPSIRPISFDAGEIAPEMRPSSDLVDALSYGMSPAAAMLGMTAGIRARQDALMSQRQAHMEREVAMRGDPRPPVRVEFRHPSTVFDRREGPRHYPIREAHVSVMGWSTDVQIEELPGMPLEVLHREVVNRATHEFSQMIEHALMNDILGAERTYQREVQEVRQINRSPRGEEIWRRMHHGVDLARGAAEWLRESIPLKPWFKHKRFELNGWKAELLENEEQIKGEGEAMQHCFARTYRNKIAREEYVGYHITAPEGEKLPKSGFTVGYHYEKGRGFRFDQVRGKKNDCTYCEHPALKALIDQISKAINADPKNRVTSAVDIANEALAQIGAMA